MFARGMCAALIILATSAAWAQELATQEAAPQPLAPAQATPATEPTTFMIQITEFRLPDSTDPRLTADEILAQVSQLKSDGKLDLVETMRLTALENHKSMVQIGKQVAVTSGAVLGPSGRATRQYHTQQVGTLVNVTATWEHGKVALQLMYEASRLPQAPADDTPPETISVHFASTLLVTPGKPTLIGGSSANATTYLMVTVQKTEP